MGMVARRLSLGILLIALASAVLLLSEARPRGAQSQHMPRVAVLQQTSQPTLDEGVDGMLQGLAEGGFVDGRTILLRRYNAEGDAGTSSTIAKEITSGQYDLVLTASTLSMQAVANANKQGKTRHVFALVTDPFAALPMLRRDDPLAHPPYMAGYATMQPVDEAFALARKLFPRLSTVGVVWNPAESNSEVATSMARAACKTKRLELLEATVDNSSGVKESASSLVARGVQALFVGGDTTVLTALETVVEVARQARIPVFTVIPGSAKKGTLFDVGADYHEVGHVAGTLAARILHGTDPATVPIENVVPKTMVVNITTASGLKDPWRIPDDVLAAAQTVIDAEGVHVKSAPGRPKAASAASSSAPALSKTWKLDLLEYVDVPDVEEAERGIRAGLEAAALVDGRDYSLTKRSAQGDMPTLSTLVDAAVNAGTDLLFTLSTPTLQAALQRARGLPIVFTFVADPLKAGAGRTSADHLHNVTGVPTTAAYEEVLALARECLPEARRLGTLFVPAEVNSVYNKDQLALAAPKYGFELVTVPVNSSAEVSDAALALLSKGIDAVCQAGSNQTSAAFASIALPATRARIPVFGFLTSDLQQGAAVVAVRDYFDAGREAAALAARIMRGEEPGKIPFQPLGGSRILVNLKAARAVGLDIPPSLLARATAVGGR
jgi:ABC-type uncharacterized transport system substrate-binding protein